MVLRHTYSISHGYRLIHLFVEIHFLDDSLDERPGVGLVVYGEVGVITNMTCLCPKDMREYRVECSHIDIACLWAYDGLDTLFHLLCRLVGECEGKDVPWL